MKINNSGSNEDSFFFKLLAAIAVIVIVSVAVLLVSNISKGDGSDEAEDTFPPVVTTAPGAVITEPVTEPVDTTEAQDTDEPEDTTGADTEVPDETSASSDVAPSGIMSESEMLEKYPDVVLSATADAGQEYVDGIIFLGDSTTYGLKAYKMLKDGKDTKQVWTPKNGTLTLSRATSDKIVYPETDEEMTIADAVKTAKPSMMVITLGVNGVSFLDETQFKSSYTGLITAIKDNSPDTKIILQSIFPVAKSYDTSSKIDNDKINAANVWIADIAKECGVKYLYSCVSMMDENGYLPEDCQNGDGMHLNTAGFTKELTYLKTHAYK